MNSSNSPVVDALSHPETQRLSNCEIAQLCGVNESTVRYWRKKLKGAAHSAQNSAHSAHSAQNSAQIRRPQYHPYAQSQLQTLSDLNPIRCQFPFMDETLEGEIVGVVMDWWNLSPAAVLVNHRYGQTQMPMKNVKVLLPGRH